VREVTVAQRVEVEVEIAADGQVSLKVRGVKGKGCVDLAKALEAALGETEERSLTPEYYEAAQVAQTSRRT
jgi:hypothetical protein